jgi:hypothetical protein
MGRRGPPPISPENARLRGTFRPDRHGKRRVQPTMAPIGTAPPWFTRETLTIWNSIVASAPPGHLKAADAVEVGALVVAIVAHRRAALRLLELVDPPVELETRVIRLVASITGIRRALALAPIERMRLAATGAPDDDEEPGTGWELLKSLRVIPGGKAR